MQTQTLSDVKQNPLVARALLNLEEADNRFVEIEYQVYRWKKSGKKVRPELKRQHHAASECCIAAVEYLKRITEMECPGWGLTALYCAEIL